MAPTSIGLRGRGNNLACAEPGAPDNHGRQLTLMAAARGVTRSVRSPCPRE